MPTNRTFRIFVSSTFADMKAERNALQEHVFPKLQALCESHGCRFQAVDLRWGVSEEAALDQQTMNICLTELKRCQSVSPRPNFVILLGDRYGWMPLPPQIEASEFDEICSVLAEADKERLLEWYRLDTNAVQPEYVLRPRREDKPEEAGYEAWGSIEAGLHAILLNGVQRLGCPTNDPRRVKYECSATHQEIINGALHLPDEREHVFAFLRNIENVDQLPRPSDYVDEGVDRARALKQTLKNILGVTSFEYTVTWAGSEITSHIEQFTAHALESLTRVIEDEIGKLDEISELTREDIAHQEFGAERCRLFIGREQILADIGAYLDGGERSPLVVYGRSGSGKSALMAKAVIDAAQRNNQSHIIQRFVGATPMSTDIRTLLRNVCEELTLAYQGDMRTIPTDYNDLQQDFPRRLALAIGNNPLIVFLDALDQLSATDNAHGLTWLPTMLPENVKVVVSVLERHDEAGACYRSAKVKVPEAAMLRLTDMTADEGSGALSAWLGDARRELTADQRAVILAGFRECPEPLYLKLSFEEARRWRSYDAPGSFAADVPGLVRGMLSRLGDKRQHGEVLVRTFLGLLCAARRGLSEAEILALLSGDADVMADLRARSSRSPEATGIPVVVWLRLYHDLAPYLMERTADHAALYNFYHRQVDETVRGTFLKPQYHEDLADYFDRQPSGPRQTDELPWQLAEAGEWQRLYDLMSGRDFLMDASVSNEFDVKAYWARVEANSSLRMVEAYRAQIENVEAEPDKLYLNVLSRLLADTGHPEEALRLRSSLVDYFRDTGATDQLGPALNDEALVLYSRGDLDRAMALHKEGEQICRRCGDQESLAISINNQAIILQCRGDLDGAMALNKESEQLCRELGDLAGIARSRSNQAELMRTRGDLDGAMALFKESEQVFRQLGNLDGLQGCIGNQAEIMRTRGDLDGAMDSEKEQERICRQLGNQSGIALSIGNRAATLQERGNLDEATVLLKEQERIYRQLGNLDGLQLNLGNQARMSVKRGDPDGAISLNDEAERICRELGNLAGLHAILVCKAMIHFDRYDMKGAMSLFEEAEQVCRKVGNQDALQAILSQKAAVVCLRGDMDAAMALLKESERICRQVGNLIGLVAILGEQALILKSRKDLDGALTLYKEGEQICRDVGNLDGLRLCLGGEAEILRLRGNIDDALSILCEQEGICRKLGQQAHLARSLFNQAIALSTRAGNEEEARSKYVEAHALYSALNLTVEAAEVQACLDRPKSLGVRMAFYFTLGIVLPIALGAIGIELGLRNPWLWFIGGPLTVVAAVYLIVLNALMFSPRFRSSFEDYMKQVSARAKLLRR